ncbi:MAG: WbqC family protein [Paludibacteraceae bacterium]|nr:WbqC family protein [Paludibacteraceae bacterium]
MNTLLLQTAYLAPIAYYAVMAQADEVVIEQYDSYHKQTLRNRCFIGAESGRMALNIPVVRTGSKQLVKDVRISYQSNWQHQHWQALKSAYNLTPFFEYYADDLLPYYQRQTEFLIDFNIGLQETVMDLLDIHTEVRRSTDYCPADAAQVSDEEKKTTDLRDHFHAKHEAPRPMPPYWQVFQHRNGFLPDLSIVDLLFNLGPESSVYLMQKNMTD